MQELAKSMWAIQSGIEAEALFYLRELSRLGYNYSEAVEDLTKAISIKVKTAPAGSEALAGRINSWE